MCGEPAYTPIGGRLSSKSALILLCVHPFVGESVPCVEDREETRMRRSIILAIASLVALAAPADMAFAASADEAMGWLAGRWTNKGDCGIGSVQFQRSGAGW